MLPIEIFKIINSDNYNNLNNYLVSFENFLNIELEKIHDNQENLLKGEQGNLKINDYSNEIELFNERRYYYGTVFTSNFRITLLSLIISSLENILKDMCYQYKIIQSSSFDVNDLKGNSDIEKAKVYLTKVSNKNIGKIPKWAEINDYKFIRNKFTHQNGRVYSKSSDVMQLKTISAKYNGINLFEENGEIRIWLSDEIFCKNAINDVYGFINDLIDILKDD